MDGRFSNIYIYVHTYIKIHMLNICTYLRTHVHLYTYVLVYPHVGCFFICLFKVNAGFKKVKHIQSVCVCVCWVAAAR